MYQLKKKKININFIIFINILTTTQKHVKTLTKQTLYGILVQYSVKSKYHI